MKDHVITDNVITNMPSSGRNFTIKASRKSFQVLSSGLYEDKIKAIIREISCNAIDAHVAGGQTEKRFQVHLPTNFEPWFSVKDFGIGMDENTVNDVFTSYFTSTKSTSDDYIGAMGLGSKSPFSYTDSFTVTSIKDGIKVKFVAVINNEGVPDLLPPLENGPTDEPSGTELSFPVDTTDCETFAEKAVRVFMHFDEDKRPEVNTKIYHDKLAFFEQKFQNFYSGKAKNWKLFSINNWNMPDGTYQGSCVFVRMGQILYPFAEDRIQDDFIRKTLSNQYQMVLDVPIGTCDVAPSREKLNYDAETISNVNSLLKDAVDEMMSIFDEDLKTKTLWEQVSFLRDKRTKSNHPAIVALLHMPEREKFITSSTGIGVKMLNASEQWRPVNSVMAYNRKTRNDGSVQLGRNVNAFSVYPGSETVVMDLTVDFLVKGNKKPPKTLPVPLRGSLRAYLAQNPGVENIITVVNGDQTVFDEMGNPPTIKGSDLPKPLKTTYVKRIKGGKDKPSVDVWGSPIEQAVIDDADEIVVLEWNTTTRRMVVGNTTWKLGDFSGMNNMFRDVAHVTKLKTIFTRRTTLEIEKDAKNPVKNPKVLTYTEWVNKHYDSVYKVLEIAYGESRNSTIRNSWIGKMVFENLVVANSHPILMAIKNMDDSQITKRNNNIHGLTMILNNSNLKLPEDYQPKILEQLENILPLLHVASRTLYSVSISVAQDIAAYIRSKKDQLDTLTL